MRTHTVPFYCLAIGQCVGVILEKIFQYDVSDKEYKFKLRFAPITRVKKCDFGQPVTYGGQTFFFGHEAKTLYEMAAIVKREHDEVIRAQLNHFTFLSRKLDDEWVKVIGEINQELALAGQPSVGIPAAAHTSMPQSQNAATPVREDYEPQGKIERRIAAYNVYAASTRPPGAGKDCASAAYCAFVHNISTGECSELMAGCGARSLSRLDVLALCAVFESGGDSAFNTGIPNGCNHPFSKRVYR